MPAKADRHRTLADTAWRGNAENRMERIMEINRNC
jgi:hypothetical protein